MCQQPKKQSLHYDYIDALRGYAILGVMAVHAAQSATDWSGPGRLVVEQGARGVQLFFVASALTLIMSWRSRNDGAARFYIRRLFRIAPMFWLGIVFFVATMGFGARYFAPNGIDLTHVVATGAFLHGWHPEYITSVVPGGWSIAVEMSFYAIFPLLMLFVRGHVSAILFFIAAAVVANAAVLAGWMFRHELWPDLPDYLVATFLSLSFPNQLPVFAAGFILYFCVTDHLGKLSKAAVRGLLALSLLLMVVIALVPMPVSQFGNFRYLLYAICFGAFSFCLAEGVSKALVNRSIRYLGTISFSAYLWHFAIINAGDLISDWGLFPLSSMDARGLTFFFGYFAFVVLLTVVCSSVTYYLVERPGIQLGKKVIRRFSDQEYRAMASESGVG